MPAIEHFGLARTRGNNCPAPLFSLVQQSMQDGAVKKDLNALQVVSASSLMAGALQAALIQTLIRKNIISDQEGHEIYEQALLLLETSQTNSSSQAVFE